MKNKTEALLFQKQILHPDKTPHLTWIKNPENTIENKWRFSIYENAYLSRLISILEQDFEGTHYALKYYKMDDLFKEYLLKYPSLYPTVSLIGLNLPKFLSELKNKHSSPAYAIIEEIAKIELKKHLVFFMKNKKEKYISWEEFQKFNTIKKTKLSSFVFVMISDFNILPFLNLKKPSKFHQYNNKTKILIWRTSHYQVKHRVITNDELYLLNKIKKGSSFEDMVKISVEKFGEQQGLEKIAHYMQLWLKSDLIIKP